MKWFLYITTLPVLCTCTMFLYAGDPEIVTKTDEFENYTIQCTTNNEVYGNKWDKKVYLNFMQHVKEDTTYYVSVRYLGGISQGWVFIEDGKSLFIKLKDTTLSFEALGRPIREVERSVISEYAAYETDAETLRKIAYAESGKIKIKGSKKNLIRDLGDRNFKIFRKFVEEVIGDRKEPKSAILE